MRPPIFMRPLVFIGVVCLLFGILIVIFPNLLSYLVATFLIVIGALAIIGSLTFRRW
ncbi:hypothetical protein ES706_02237 [subsurface metagenome]